MRDPTTGNDIMRMLRHNKGRNVRGVLESGKSFCMEGSAMALGMSAGRRRRIAQACRRYAGKSHIRINDGRGSIEQRRAQLTKVAEKLGVREGVGEQKAQAEAKKNRDKQKAHQQPGATPSKRRKKRQESRPDGCCVREPAKKPSTVFWLIGMLVAVVMAIEVLRVAMPVLTEVAWWVLHVVLPAVGVAWGWYALSDVEWPWQRAQTQGESLRFAYASEPVAAIESAPLPVAAEVLTEPVDEPIEAELMDLDLIGVDEDARLKMAWVYGPAIDDQYVEVRRR